MPQRRLATSIDIACAPDKVWSVFSDFPKWRDWNDGFAIDVAAAGSALKPGDTIAVSLTQEGSKSPYKFQPKVISHAPGAEFSWRGHLMAEAVFCGQHYFRLEPSADGRSTRFVHGEEFKGLLLPVLGGMLKQTEKEFERFNVALKRRCESVK